MANNSKKPLEWSGKMRLVSSTDTNPKNTKINLALRDDEIAEIHKIQTEFMLSIAAATTSARADFVISMDPDTVQDPGEAVTFEDLEVFHSETRMRNPFQSVADIDELIDEVISRDVDFKNPVLVGTNLGISSQFTWLTADSTGWIKVKVFFTRRKATVQELNQILLKRR
jgi:hypothetical protein